MPQNYRPHDHRTQRDDDRRNFEDAGRDRVRRGEGRDAYLTSRTDDERWRERERSRGLNELMREDLGSPAYFGTGRHFGGGYGTAPGTRASSEDLWSRSGYGEPRRERDARDFAESATSGAYENYGRSTFGAQSGYGRDYGQPDRQNYGGRQAGSGGDYRQNWIGESEGSQQSFRGRGPRGYERSDERLKEIICERLTDHPRIDASDVSIDVNQKVVKLTGAVDDRRMKYEIEDVVEQCGVTDIDNQLRVQSASRR